MHKSGLLVAGLLFPLISSASPWQFSTPIEVAPVHTEQLFQHLESSGRRNIAVAGDTVAVTWEDNRDETPRIYLAKKSAAAGRFSPALRLSGEGEAYEPSLAALAEDRFAVAWEEDGRIHLRVVMPGGVAVAETLAASDSVQASVWGNGNEVLLVDTERAGRFSRIMFHQFAVSDDGSLQEKVTCPVDAQAPIDDQLYPTVLQQAGKIVVAWEDRRPGHTIIMASESRKGSACSFTPPQRISLRPGHNQKMPYGRGHGVSRVALAAFGKKAVLAAWADKRNFREGYDIYSAIDEGDRGFGKNERVQDEFGGVAQQWHVTVAGAADGTLVAAWDDNRDGDANVMMSWRDASAWSEDVVVPGAAGAGEQEQPSIALDSQGNLHVVWVERATRDGPARLFYCKGSKH